MKLLTKCPVYLKLRISSKTQSKLITQSLSYGPNLTKNTNYNAVCGTNDTNFPHLQNSSIKETILWGEHVSKQKLLVTELCEECGFQGSISHENKKSLLKLNIEALNNLDLLPTHKDVIKNMLNYLEPFPFSMDDVSLKGSIRKIDREIEDFTVSMLRNSIERQYLAWKFKVSLEMAERILMYLRGSFYKGRSLQSLKRNVELLNACYKLSKMDMPKQLYLLSQLPFNPNILKNFQDNLFGLDWLQIGICYPKILRTPYHCIMLRLKALQGEGFSNEQLKNAFPVLGIQSLTVMKILTLFENFPNIYNYREDLYFLRLLYVYGKGKYKNIDWSQTNYEDLKSELSKQQKFVKGFSELVKFPRVAIALYAQIKLEADEEQLTPIKSNFKQYVFSFCGLLDTLSFLKEKNFTHEEIIDCITVIFYPRQVIEKVLNTMANDEKTLEQLGFVNGHVDKTTLFFECGSKLRNKTLHLCLYYIQKSNDFLVGLNFT